MDVRLEDMTLEEIFCAEANILSQEEYDAAIAAMQQDFEAADAPFVYLPTDAELNEMYADYTPIDYGKYGCAGFDVYDY